MSTAASASGISFQVYFPQGVPLKPSSSELTFENGTAVERMTIAGTSASKKGYFVISMAMEEPCPHLHAQKTVTLSYVDADGKPVQKTTTMGMNVHQNVCSLHNHPSLSSLSIDVRVAEPEGSVITSSEAPFTIASLYLELHRDAEDQKENMGAEKVPAKVKLMGKLKGLLN